MGIQYLFSNIHCNKLPSAYLYYQSN